MSKSPELPEFLYHGTASSLLPAIAREGLRPRGAQAQGNWGHTSPSHPEAVYLTTAYALYFASQADAPGLATILRIRTRSLNPGCLVADEDSLVLTEQGHPDLPGDADTPTRHSFWMQHLAYTSALFSLQRLGNCAHLGPIASEAIDQVVVLSREQVSYYVQNFSDPVIAPANYRYLGPDYRDFTEWLFADTPTWTSALQRRELTRAGHVYRGPLASATTLPLDET